MATLTLALYSPIFACVLLAGHSEASSTFKPNCTIPPAGTNYVAGPNVRSTLTILWNCLSIILLCTWNIQHLNVPAIRPPAKGFFQKKWRAILDLRPKIKWMLFTIFIPEFLVGKALGEWRAARYICSQDEDWELVHAYMANMGYFVLDCGDPSTAPPSGEHPEEKIPGNNTITVDATTDRKDIIDQVRDREGQLSVSSHINLERLKYRYLALDGCQWQALDTSEVAEIVEVNTSQLEKLDRGGTLVKALALVQVTYLIVQLIARKVGGLPSAQLEIAALAFAASSMTTYLLYWNRPQGVETVHIIKAKRELDFDAIFELSRQGPRYLWLSYRTEPDFDPDFGPAPIPNDASHRMSEVFWNSLVGYNDEIASLAFGALFGGTLFGGLHCLAWNFHFPTPGEALGWKICSVATTCLPLLSMVPMIAWMLLNPYYGKKEGSAAGRLLVGATGIGLFLVPYVLARLFLLVEIFRTLLFLPPEAFVDTWSGSFPHLG